MVKAGLGSSLSHFESQLCKLLNVLCSASWVVGSTEDNAREHTQPTVSIQEMLAASKVVTMK